jgi:hypothetical protein
MKKGDEASPCTLKQMCEEKSAKCRGMCSRMLITTCCNFWLNSTLPNLTINVKTFSSCEKVNELWQTMVGDNTYEILPIIDGTANISHCVNIRRLVEEIGVSVKRYELG